MTQEIEQVTERLLKSGFSLEHDWNVKIEVYINEGYQKSIKDMGYALDDGQKRMTEDEKMQINYWKDTLISQVFTVQDSEHPDQICTITDSIARFNVISSKPKMNLFIQNTDMYKYRKSITITGYSFRQGDVVVKIGSFFTDYPKYLFVQLEYLPFNISKKKLDRPRELNEKIDQIMEEIGTFALRIDKEKFAQMRMIIGQADREKLPHNQKYEPKIEIDGIKEKYLQYVLAYLN
eukprot:403344322